MAFGKTLIILGVVLIAMGLLWTLGARIDLGRLPGDIVLRGERTTFYFPVVTCLVLSVLMSLVLWLLRAFRRR